MSTKIPTENAKTVRTPFDTEFWISDNYYNVTTEATLIKCTIETTSGYQEVVGRPNTEIPGGVYRWQEVDYSSYTQRIINFKDLCAIAKKRGYPMTYGYNATDYFNNSTKQSKFVDEFHKWQSWALSKNNPNLSVTIPISAVTQNTQKNRMLILALREWNPATELTITLGTGFTKTYVGSDIVNNNIVIDLLGKANSSTTATLTWVNRRSAKVAAFTQNYLYYINRRNLISADVNLRSDLSINASTIPTSQINITALADKDIYNLYNVVYLFKNYLYYTCGYNSDLPTDVNEITIDSSMPVTARRFNINEQIQYSTNQIQIEAEDSISDLYNAHLEGVLYYNGVISLFNDYITSSSNTFAPNALTNLRRYHNFTYGRNRENSDNGTERKMGRLQFIFWLLYYSYFYSLWEKKQDIAISLAGDFKMNFSSNLDEFFEADSDYQEYAGLDMYNKDTTFNKNRPYLAAINDTAPLPLMAWIQDTWHGNITFQNYNNVQTTKFFRPQFVDAGRPTFSYKNHISKWTINEYNTKDVADVIELPKRTLIIPKRNLMAAYETKKQEFGLVSQQYESDNGESFLNFTKEAAPGSSGTQSLQVYNYGGGFHFYYYGTRDDAYTDPLGRNGARRLVLWGKDPTNVNNNYEGMIWSLLRFRYDYPNTYTYAYDDAQGIRQYDTKTVDDSVATQWEAKGFSPVEQYSESELNNTSIEEGDTITLDYENLMGLIIDNDLTKASVLGRSNNSGQFTWRGDPRIQPRDIFKFYRLDGTNITCTVETIETKHEGGGTTQTITYREGIV